MQRPTESVLGKKQRTRESSEESSSQDSLGQYNTLDQDKHSAREIVENAHAQLDDASKWAIGDCVVEDVLYEHCRNESDMQLYNSLAASKVLDTAASEFGDMFKTEQVEIRQTVRRIESLSPELEKLFDSFKVDTEEDLDECIIKHRKNEIGNKCMDRGTMNWFHSGLLNYNNLYNQSLIHRGGLSECWWATNLWHHVWDCIAQEIPQTLVQRFVYRGTSTRAAW